MIHEILLSGKDNAQTGKELANRTGLDIRGVTNQIERERREGQPICATTQGGTPGYFLAATAEELNQYCDAIKRRAIELFRTRQALINVLRQIQEAAENGKNENC